MESMNRPEVITHPGTNSNQISADVMSTALLASEEAVVPPPLPPAIPDSNTSSASADSVAQTAEPFTIERMMAVVAGLIIVASRWYHPGDRLKPTAVPPTRIDVPATVQTPLPNTDSLPANLSADVATPASLPATPTGGTPKLGTRLTEVESNFADGPQPIWLRDHSAAATHSRLSKAVAEKSPLKLPDWVGERLRHP